MSSSRPPHTQSINNIPSASYATDASANTQQLPPRRPIYSQYPQSAYTQPTWFSTQNQSGFDSSTSSYDIRQQEQQLGGARLPKPFQSSVVQSPSLIGAVRPSATPTPPVFQGPYAAKQSTISPNSPDVSSTMLYPAGRIGEILEGTDDEVEVPLLEGIYPDDIFKRMKFALFFYKISQEILIDVDMCGPVFIAACLGCCLLLVIVGLREEFYHQAGKIHFGYIYGLSVTGCIAICLLLNLMSQKDGINLYRTISILGYGLLPVVGLAIIAIFISLRSMYGSILAGICVLWCTATASRFFETALEMTHQRFLLAYPIFLLYGSFILITVF